jgi:glycosyltransferase involved in cell wall biosynthesis
MRIAFVNQPRDYMVASGAQRGSVSIVSWELARRLAARHEVVLYAPCAPGQVFEEQAADGLTIRRTPRSFRNVHRALDLVSGVLDVPRPYFARDAYFAEYANSIAAWLARDPPHIVHVQTVPQFVPTLRRAVPQARIVLHVHDEHLAHLDRSRIERHLEQADAIVTCSDYVTRRLRERFTAHAARISTIGNGVDLEEFHPAAPSDRAWAGGPPQILYIGRVSPEKGIHVLAAAFERVLETIPDARLTIVGPASILPYSRVQLFRGDAHAASLEPFYGCGLLDKLKRQVLHRRLSYIDGVLARMPRRVSARVNTAGMQEHTVVCEFYRRASVLVAPSVLPEPFGLPLVEAMASGVPVVATRDGGKPDIVEDGVTGRLVERNDVEGLARAICELVANPPLAARMGQAARATAVERFGWPQAVARLEDVYARLAVRGQAPAPTAAPVAMVGDDRI